jgi:hypothetical protein
MIDLQRSIGDIQIPFAAGCKMIGETAISMFRQAPDAVKNSP